MNKKGVEYLLVTVGYVVIILSVMAMVVYWLNLNSSGKVVNNQVVAKHVALLIDLAKPGTVVFIDKSVSIDKNKVVAGSSMYEFFKKTAVTAVNVGGGTEIKVE